MSIIEEDVSRIIRTTDLSYFLNKKVLITGASGLMGRYFTQTLLTLQSLGVGPSSMFLSSKSGHFNFDLDPSAEVIAGDLNDSNVLNIIPKVDVIIHAAGYAQPDRFLENEFSTININTYVTFNLINKVKAGGKFLFISSSEVYSGLNNPPFSEDQIGITNTNHSRAAYIEGKRTGEAIVHIANRRSGIISKSVRLSLAYGPGTKIGDSRALNSFISQAILNKKILLADAGRAMRTYCYVSDAIEMCLNVILKGDQSIYNVAGVSRVSIIDLAKTIASITDCHLIVPDSDIAALTGAPTDVWLNLDQIVALCNKSNFVSLLDGLKRTVSWQKENLY